MKIHDTIEQSLDPVFVDYDINEAVRNQYAVIDYLSPTLLTEIT